MQVLETKKDNKQISSDDGVKKLKDLYSHLGYVSLFTHIRLSHAPYQLLEKVVPKSGRILDLGCGYGLFSNFLALLSPEREVIGIEMSRRKLGYADRGLSNVKFLDGDIMQLHLQPCSGVVMTHLLHHLKSYEEQEKILSRCREILEPNGRLLVCEVDDKPRWKFAVANLIDHALYIGDRIFYRSSAEFTKLFQSLGFKLEQVLEAHRGVPLSHVIYVLSRI